MNVHRGYYSILQFCPEPARFEAANIGVALLCPDQHFFRAKIGSGNQRVTRFFDRSQYDIERLNAYKHGLIERLNRGEEVCDRESFAQFAAMQVNAIVMTQPQFCRVEQEAEAALDKLFDELVGETKRKRRKGGLKQRLRKAFQDAGVLDSLVQENVEIKVPAFGRTQKFPFAWRNGVVNLVDPVQFTAADPTCLEQTACRHAIEGQSLRRHPDKRLGQCELNVIGQFQAEDQHGRDIVNRIFGESEVELIEASSIQSYVEKIQKTGKSVSE